MKSLAYLNIPGHVLKTIRTHSTSQTPSPKNSEGLLMIYSDRNLLKRIGILLGRVIEVGERRKILYVFNKNSYPQHEFPSNFEYTVICIISLNKHFYFGELSHIKKYSYTKGGGWRNKVETL